MRTATGNPKLSSTSYGYRLEWPSGNMVQVSEIRQLSDGTRELRFDGATWKVDGIPANWTGKEIKVTIRPAAIQEQLT